MKKVILYKDQENEIILSKDHHHGVVIQVVRYIDTMMQTSDGLVSNIVRAQVMYQKQIAISETFRQDVDKEITVCHTYINDLKLRDQKINGLLNNYFSAHRDLNEPAEQ